MGSSWTWLWSEVGGGEARRRVAGSRGTTMARWRAGRSHTRKQLDIAQRRGAACPCRREPLTT